MTKKAVFLFDTTGYAAEPFTKAGVETYIIDQLNVGTRATNERASHILSWDISCSEQRIIDLAPDLLFGFPPCTDLAVSGARHFESKRKQNPSFQEDALKLALSVERIGRAVGCPWGWENPVSVAATMHRKPDFTFHPFEFGGWLPETDQHPEWPRYIAAQDRYRKITNWWLSENFLRPLRKVIPCKTGWNTQTTLLGGKSLKTKMIRSASPRGVFIALANRYLTHWNELDEPF